MILIVHFVQAQVLIQLNLVEVIFLPMTTKIRIINYSKQKEMKTEKNYKIYYFLKEEEGEESIWYPHQKPQVSLLSAETAGHCI